MDDVFVIPFSREIASWTPEEFIERVLVDGLHAAHVVVGANFRFGARAAGDVATLAQAWSHEDFEAAGIALDGGPQVWSSTYVRTCLAAGDVEGAAEALGKAVLGSSGTSSGATSEGASSATRPPTCRRATPQLPPTGSTPDGCACSPQDGEDPSGPLPVAISVGTNPTFEGRARAPGRVLRPRPHRPGALRPPRRGVLPRASSAAWWRSTASTPWSSRWPTTSADPHPPRPVGPPGERFR